MYVQVGSKLSPPSAPRSSCSIKRNIADRLCLLHICLAVVVVAEWSCFCHEHVANATLCLAACISKPSVHNIEKDMAKGRRPDMASKSPGVRNVCQRAEVDSLSNVAAAALRRADGRGAERESATPPADRV